MAGGGGLGRGSCEGGAAAAAAATATMATDGDGWRRMAARGQEEWEEADTGSRLGGGHSADGETDAGCLLLTPSEEGGGVGGSSHSRARSLAGQQPSMQGRALAMHGGRHGGSVCGGCGLGCAACARPARS